jgi:two-component system, chemotaxis family, response regulator Rcp1
MTGKPVEILLVEDNLADARLMVEALKDCKVPNRLHIARDGIQALNFLHQDGEFAQVPRPDLIFLDLNLPRKDGREVLAEIKADPNLKTIPVIVLTSSQAEQDIVKTYDLQANCYVNKPVDLDQFLATMEIVENFWLTLANLPPRLANEEL